MREKPNRDIWIDGDTIRIGGKSHHVPSMSKEDLLSLKARINSRILEVSSQLDEAHATRYLTGKRADPRWYGRARHLKLRLGQAKQLIQARQCAIRKETFDLAACRQVGLGREKNRIPGESRSKGG